MSDGLTDRRSEKINKCSVCKEEKYQDDFFNFTKKICYLCQSKKSLSCSSVDKVEGMKFDEDKLRYDLIPPEVLLWLAELYTHGAKKYAPDNWKKVSIEKYIAAFHRHFNDWRLGIDLDKDSSMHHLKHALWNIATIAWLEIEGNKPKKG